MTSKRKFSQRTGLGDSSERWQVCRDLKTHPPAPSIGKKEKGEQHPDENRFPSLLKRRMQGEFFAAQEELCHEPDSSKVVPSLGNEMYKAALQTESVCSFERLYGKLSHPPGESTRALVDNPISKLLS